MSRITQLKSLAKSLSLYILLSLPHLFSCASSFLSCFHHISAVRFSCRAANSPLMAPSRQTTAQISSKILSPHQTSPPQASELSTLTLTFAFYLFRLNSLQQHSLMFSSLIYPHANQPDTMKSGGHFKCTQTKTLTPICSCLESNPRSITNNINNKVRLTRE